MRLAYFELLVTVTTLFASATAGQPVTSEITSQYVASSVATTKNDAGLQKRYLRTLTTVDDVGDSEEERGLISGAKKLLEKVKTNNAAKKLRKEALAREAALKQAATKAKQAETQKMLDMMLTNRNYRFETFDDFFNKKNIRSQHALPDVLKQQKYKDVYHDFGVYLGEKGHGNVIRVPI
ncbi:hypothetical protein PHYBOEH_000378 [Phytophthora boehmeriae]|uniref:RxLR effector protein n=1 Tax=Phytophthora boehmeriae TaxID=109152 RepID=A0A8T1VE83_9STRA|nr:hypothetical protein PHYBOEH_000378 [Phytophthora boehmeriae]